MKTIERGNINTEIDWKSLDRCWAEQYKEDYGNLFSSTFLRKI